MSKENQFTISEWSAKTFGTFIPKDKKQVSVPIITKLKEETNELFDLCDSKESFMFADIEKVKEECADVFIVLVQLASAMGFSLQEGVDLKMKKNRKRTWEKTPEGTHRHISGD